MRAIVARIAARVREERTRQRLSLDDLALTARVSRSSLIRFEMGKSGLQLETLTRLVVLGLDLEWHAFMATTGVPREGRPRRRPAAALTLTEREVVQIRRRVRAILKILREAEGSQETPTSVS